MYTQRHVKSCKEQNPAYPIAANALRTMKFSYDYDNEHYFINLLAVETISASHINEMRLCTTDESYCTLLYRITLA
jgi:hypothetical protein